LCCCCNWCCVKLLLHTVNSAVLPLSLPLLLLLPAVP
jgi:hypothetical protein